MQCMQISVSQSMHACMLGSISRARAARPPRIACTARIIMQLHEQMHIAAGAFTCVHASHHHARVASCATACHSCMVASVSHAAEI